MSDKTIPKRRVAVTAWHIENAMSEWGRARSSLLAADPSLADDEVRLADLLRDEDAKVMDIAVELCRISINAEYMIERIDKQIGDLQSRRRQFENRHDHTKDAAFRVIEAMGFPTLREHDFTAGKGRGPGSVVITDEKLIPEEFWKIERTPRKSLIGEAIDEGRTVPGAIKTNGAAYLRISKR